MPSLASKIMEESWLFVHHNGGINLEPVEIMNEEVGLVWTCVGWFFEIRL